MRSIPCLIAFSLGLAACAPPAPPPAAPPPEVAAGSASVRPTSAMLDPYVGLYRSGAETLIIRRSGDSLIVERSGQPSNPLSLVGTGTFADAAAAVYLFTPGASGRVRLTIVTADGNRREWTS